MAINWIETEVIEHIKWTDSLASLKFKGNVLPYVSGQFTKVGLKINDELIIIICLFILFQIMIIILREGLR